MKISDKKGVVNIELSKEQVRRMLETSYFAGRIAVNITSDADAKLLKDLALSVAKRYGGKHLNADGSLKEPESRKRDESEAPEHI
jgi:hypothetical protein